MSRKVPASSSAGSGHAANALFPVQAFHSFGESLFALSLVGSLFFSVSIDAARPRIILYLAVTMAPFAVLGPLIGPMIDRVRGGHRMVLASSLIVRSLIALLLSTQLTTLLFYPEAFALLVGAKGYAVGRNSIVPSLVGDDGDLMSFNARVARVGNLAGMLGGAFGVVILRVGGASMAVRCAALAFALGAFAALRVPQPTTTTAVPIEEETLEMHRRGVLSAAGAMAVIRFATGFAVFHVGFVLKSSGRATWVIGAVGGAIALGGFLGTFTAPHLRRRHDEQQMLTGAILGLAAVAALSATWFAGPTALALGLALGLAGSVGRRAFDGIVQTDAPHARRGRAFAGLETRLELGWVAGALLAVVSRAPGWLGLAVLTVVLGAAGVTRASRGESKVSRPISGR